MGILPNHANFIGRLGMGPAHIRLADEERVFVLRGGWVHIQDNVVELAADEVSRVFTIPVDWLANQDNYELRPRERVIPGKPVSVVYYQHYDGELLWGATARMTLSLLETLVFER